MSQPEKGPKKARRNKADTGAVSSEREAADRWLSEHSDDYYNVARMGWFAWTGTHSTLDTAERVRESVKTTLAGMRAEAAVLADDALWKLTRSLDTARGISAILDVARSDPRVRVGVEDLDRDPYLLTCRSGTIDLRAGELREHRRDDLITHCVPHAYDPDASCDRWLRFLDEITCGRPEIVAFLRRWAGYCLTGSIREHALVMAVGKGCNGKSVLLEALRHVMGDLAVTAPPGLLLLQKGERHPTELARLRGRRLAITNEMPKGSAFNEERVKDLTGGTVISARGMRENFYDFEPTHKLTIACNEAPRVRDTSAGFWRRMRIVPFDADFQGREDRSLPETLRAEAAGILAWAVAGAVEWYEHGLGEPVAVMEATEAYREGEDKVGRWLGDTGPYTEGTAAKDLMTSHRQWAEEQGENPLSAKALGDELARRGWRKHRVGRAKVVTWHPPEGGRGTRSDTEPPVSAHTRAHGGYTEPPCPTESPCPPPVLDPNDPDVEWFDAE